METIIIEFTAGTHPGQASVMIMPPFRCGEPAEFIGIKFVKPVKGMTGKEFTDLNKQVLQAVETVRSEFENNGGLTVGDVGPVVNLQDSALPVQKMNFGQALAHVFKGGDGRSMMDRLGDIQKMAEGEMNEKEKSAANSVMKGLKDLAGK